MSINIMVSADYDALKKPGNATDLPLLSEVFQQNADMKLVEHTDTRHCAVFTIPAGKLEDIYVYVKDRGYIVDIYAAHPETGLPVPGVSF